MAYHCTILFPFVSMILRSTQATGHTARSKALTMLLQGLLCVQQASLSGMSRGVAVVYAEKSFRGQLKRAHRWLKHAQIDTWATGAALFAPMTQNLQQVGIAVDRGFATFAWVGESPLYPCMHLLLRFKCPTL